MESNMTLPFIIDGSTYSNWEDAGFSIADQIVQCREEGGEHVIYAHDEAADEWTAWPATAAASPMEAWEKAARMLIQEKGLAWVDLTNATDEADLNILNRIAADLQKLS